VSRRDRVRWLARRAHLEDRLVAAYAAGSAERVDAANEHLRHLAELPRPWGLSRWDRALVAWADARTDHEAGLDARLAVAEERAATAPALPSPGELFRPVVGNGWTPR